jgi:8-oxo-(d)GTP phosphatase
MPNNKPPDSKMIKAAGAVAWRPRPDGGEPEVLLVHRKKYDDWSLPKGKAEPGEPLPVTAIREVLEEGGARLALGRRLGSVRYQVSGRPKRVHYWAARVIGVDDEAVPNAEVDQVSWLPSARAREHVSYSRDIGLVDEFARLPVGTVPLILLRHAKAVAKSGWQRDDAARPLDDSGRADAMALATLLACFAPAARILSSPALRCLETVRPYAELIGGTVQVAPALHIESSRTDGGAWPAGLIADLIAAQTPTVVCAHRENLPELLGAALAAAGPAPQALPAGWDAPLPTAAFLALHLADGAIVAADRYDLSDT